MRRSGHRRSDTEKLLARFASDRSGNTAILFGLVSVVLLLAIGAAVDIGRWLHAKDQTAAAVDAALLAGGRALQTNSTDTEGALAAAVKFYDQNIRTRLDVTDDSVSFAVADDGMAITARGTAYIKTPFLKLANIDKLPLINPAKAEFSKARISVGGNGGENVEIAMMLDVTGSMCEPCSKLEAMKEAAKDLVSIVVWKDQSKFTSKVALVPFAEDIRLPSAAVLDAARSATLPKSKTVNAGPMQKTYYLSDCVVERTGNEKYTDAAPASGQYVMGHYTEESTGSGANAKGVCKVPESSSVVPLSSDVDALRSKIEGLSADAGTAGHLGTAWAWYMLSPSWASLWPAASRPVAYGTAQTKKIAILMTDGEYNAQYDGNGVLANFGATSCPQAANGCSSAQALSLCKAMKDKGITIYTVLFGLKNNQAAINTMNTCATDPGKFYNAEDGEQLKDAFRDIALKLSSLYLSK
jgi:hypothetical protein